MIIEHPDSSPTKLILLADFSMSARKLFEFFTESDLITKWWVQETEINPDGTYHFAWSSMNWHLRGRFNTLEFSNTFSFTWKWDHEPNLPEHTVNISLTETGNSTQLRLEHGTYTLSPEDQADRQSHLDGWQYFLPQLQKRVAS